MDCSLPGSSVSGILQAGILEGIAIYFSRDLPDRGIQLGSPALHADHFSRWRKTPFMKQKAKLGKQIIEQTSLN